MKKRNPELARARLTLEMSQATRSLLEDLQGRTGAGSAAEVIRRSLALYDMVATETRAGRALVLRDPNGTEERLRLL